MKSDEYSAKARDLASRAALLRSLGFLAAAAELQRRATYAEMLFESVAARECEARCAQLGRAPARVPDLGLSQSQQVRRKA